MFINIYNKMWIINIIVPLALLITHIKADDATCRFNLTLHDIVGELSFRLNDGRCKLRFATQSDRNIIAIFPARKLTFSEFGNYRNMEVYDGDVDMNNATPLKRLSPFGRYFRGMSFSTKGPHMTVFSSVIFHNPKNKDTINIEIKLDDCYKEFNGLNGEFQTTQYPGLNGLSYPINANCRISIIPFLGCSTDLHISEYDVREVDDIFIMVGDSRREVRGPMSYLIQPSANFTIVLNASPQTDGAGGISGYFSVCYRLTSSSSGKVSLPFHPFRSKYMGSTCAFLIGTPYKNIIDISITLVSAVNNTSSYVGIYSEFQVPRLIKNFSLSEWHDTETHQTVSNETVILFHATEGNDISMLHISYSSRSNEENPDILMKEITKPAAAICAIAIAVNFAILLLIRPQIKCKPCTN